jgi:hypothetical protein
MEKAMTNERASHVGSDTPEEGGAMRGASVPREPTPLAPGADADCEDHMLEVEAELAGHLHAADVEGATLSDEEIDAYRRRVAEGFYNTREMAAEVARRMLRRGDI